MPSKSRLDYLLPSALMMFAIVLLPLTPTKAAGECFVKYSKTNICDFAKKVQQEMAPSLPMQLSSNLVLRSIAAIGPVLWANAILKYDEKFLNQTLKQQGAPRAIIDMKMREMTHNRVCSGEQMRAFLDLGGHIVYSYEFIDGNKYLEIKLTPKTC